MPSKDFEVKLSDELNFWAARVFDKIKQNFLALDINRTPGGKGPEYTGDLFRTLWWTVYNAAGGDKAMITFFYLKYGDFVQWGVGTGVKKWDVPKMTDMVPIKHPSSRRKSKPFLRSEVTRQAKWLLKRLAEQYVYGGNLYIVKGLAEGIGDTSITQRWIDQNKDELRGRFKNLFL